MEIPELGHEKLDVYQRAVKFLALAAALLESLPRGNATLADQVRRESLSIPLNIAEGAGRTQRKDAQRFYAIARGSTMECASILDACKILRLIEPAMYADGKTLLTRVAAMLSRLVV